ncbi:MAG: esterase family protein [Acidobacteria bacterium]|nr:esterase family protein [Acidobacteriota bacterium]
MHREYHKWKSVSLDREMELLIFGHAGVPVVVFPTSHGRFYEFEDQGMVRAVSSKIEHGQVQLICVDSIDNESWFAEQVPGRWRIARQLQFERYILDEVVPYVRKRNHVPHMAAAGCSFGGYHAANISFRNPEIFTAMLTMGGTFNPEHFLRGHYDEDCYYNLPTHFLPNMSDPWYLDKYRHNSYMLATGVHDHHWDDNEKFAALLRLKGIPVQLDVWQDCAGHNWYWWQRMLAAYL